MTPWRGEDLTDKSILVTTEQGVGDEVMYASMLPDLLARDALCIIKCTPRLVPVFARSFPSALVWPPGAHEPVADYVVSIGSLGRFFRLSLESFPWHAGYLKADSLQKAMLRQKYRAVAGTRRIAGIAWRGREPAKSAKLASLGALFMCPGIMWVNLQYGDCAEEIAAANAPIYQDKDVDPLVDLDAHFAQVAAMDFVVSTSNTAAHIAGSLGVPTHVMLPHGGRAPWYWSLKPDTSPWYPSAHLYRSEDKSTEPWETSVAASLSRMETSVSRNAAILPTARAP